MTKPSRKMRVLLTLAGVAAGLVVTGFIAVQIAIRSLDSVRITDDVHMITGLGGNVGVLRTGAGTVIVDSMTFAVQGERIAKKAEELTGEPVVLVINTHYHLDHSHGNPGFAAGTRVVSTERTLHHLTTLDAKYWADDAAAFLPSETFTDRRTITLGDKTIELLHPGRGHTDGDLVAHFVEDRVVHLGDLFFNRHYPNIDLEAGGSVARWGASLDVVLALPFEAVIPGHGKASGREDLVQYQTFIEQLAGVGAKAAADGWTVERTVAEGALDEDRGYTNVLPMLTREFVLTRAWEEATGAVTGTEPAADR